MCIIGNTTAFNETNIELSKATNFKANGKQKTSDNYWLQNRLSTTIDLRNLKASQFFIVSNTYKQQ